MNAKQKNQILSSIFGGLTATIRKGLEKIGNEIPTLEKKMLLVGSELHILISSRNVCP